ncbi:cell division protein FtsQ [Mycolicibacterium insubricum]|uniref:Cell division protein FtsQ n=1 Tax=Mycolicibacterium insubricum TaxID=444597 RepID=A0A1X0DJ00_9MYCO|nr:FtsQ-type POTRA domain-containing protein [Mycolicibacterium sp.]ORA72374.1 cell division protein FtsQ [Mycolicibacterium insubricum]BBZ67676.1 cell division protein FtsQ [Mycolicibacterium insubricum]
MVSDEPDPDAADDLAGQQAAQEAEQDAGPEEDSAGADFEGPRRRERRERAERRALSERARTLERARLEAKRKADAASVEPHRTPSRGVVRGLKALVWAVLAAVLVVGLGLVLYFTPLMSVRSVDVFGTQAVGRDEVLDVAAVPHGLPLLQLDTDAVAARVAGIRRVASARVQREYPSTVRITIAERIPVAMRDFPDGPHVYDRVGVDFGSEDPAQSLPYLDVENPGPGDPSTRAALEVLTTLRPEIAGQVGRVAAPTAAAVTLTLTDGRVVVWGSTDRSQEKAEKLAALLTVPGRSYDVSSPELATVK